MVLAGHIKLTWVRWGRSWSSAALALAIGAARHASLHRARKTANNHMSRDMAKQQTNAAARALGI